MSDYMYSTPYQSYIHGVVGQYPEVDNPRVVGAAVTDLSPVQLNTTEYARFVDIGKQVTSRIEKFTNTSFMPLVKERGYNALYNDGIDSLFDTLKIKHPLSQVNGVTLADGTVLDVDNDILLSPDDVTPAYKLMILNSAGTWTQYSDEWRNAIKVTGIWCYRSDFADDGFIDSLDDNISSLTTSTTTIAVTNARGANENGFSPRYDVGQLIRITTDSVDEYMLITSVDFTTNELTVKRGQRGTPEATHDGDSDIYSFVVQSDIMHAAARATDFEYYRRNKYHSLELVGEGATLPVLPKSWPQDVWDYLSDYIPLVIGKA